jgi:hypothetical protein
MMCRLVISNKPQALFLSRDNQFSYDEKNQFKNDNDLEKDNEGSGSKILKFMGLAVSLPEF